MHRQADGFGLIGQGALDGLLDPPGTVGGKFAAFGRVEPFHRLHQPDVPLADQIQQGQPEVLVIMGDFDHQAQIGLDHLFPRLLVAFSDARRQHNLLLRGQELDLADFAQVKLDRRLAVIRLPVPIQLRRQRLLDDDWRGLGFQRRGRRRALAGAFFRRGETMRRALRRPLRRFLARCVFMRFSI